MRTETRGRPREDGREKDEYVGRKMKPWEPKEISTKHKHMAALSAGGLDNKEVAEVVGLSESRVSIILNDPRIEKLKRQLVDEYVREMAEDTAEVIQSYTREAAEKIAELMRHSTKDGVQLRAAENFLDRGGHPKVKEQVQTEKLPPLDNEKVDLLREAIREATGEAEEVEMVQDTSGVFIPEEG